MTLLAAFALTLSALLVAPDASPADGVALDRLIEAHYAYLDELPGKTLPDSPALADRRAAIDSEGDLLRYIEARLHSLADHHAAANSNFADSWALVPTYSDLWIDADLRVGAVREGSPAARVGILPGDRLVAVGETDANEAIAAFWDDLGLVATPERAAYAARLLAAGRRDRARYLSFARAGSVTRYRLPSLYDAQVERPLLSVEDTANGTVIRIHNSLGDVNLIPAFDAAVAASNPSKDLVIDLRDTPSGGNTTVARAMMGWFVDRPTPYQMHDRPDEARAFEIERRWIELVMPRPGKHDPRRPTILVGRWTGSMGEGLAIGFSAIGMPVVGAPMAGLRGAIESYPVGDTSIAVSFPTERLFSVDGKPREDFEPDVLHGE